MIKKWIISCCIFLSAGFVVSAATIRNANLVVSSQGKDILRFDRNFRFTGAFALEYEPAFTTINSIDAILYSSDKAGTTVYAHALNTGKLLYQRTLGGQLVAGEYDSFTNQVFLLDRGSSVIYVLDGTNLAPVKRYSLDGTPSHFAFDPSTRTLYVAQENRCVVALAADNGVETGRITDLETPPLTVSIDRQHRRLLIQEDKWIALYRISDLRFIDYLPLEADPAAIQIDNRHARLYVLVDDQPQSIAVFDLQTLHLEKWIGLKRWSYQGRPIDPATFYVDEISGQIYYFDRTTQSFFIQKQAVYTGPSAPAAVPPGVTPGPDLHINETIDSGPQILPTADFDGYGNFVITWTDDNGNDGNGEGVYVREYNSNQTPVANEYLINDQTSGDQGTSTVAVADNGDFVVIWRDDTDPGADFGVYARCYNKGGISKGPSFLVNETTTGRQMAPSVSSMAGGTFVTAWSGPGDGDGRGTFTRRYNSNCQPLESEKLSNTTANGNTWAVDVAVNNNGRYVVVWRDDSSDRIRGRAFDANGNPVASTDFTVGPMVNGAKNFEPSVAIAEDGSFIVVWRETAAGGIVGQKLDANQNLIGSPFLITSAATNFQYSPSISMAPDGRFFVTWRDSGYSNDEIVGRLFDNNAQALGPDFVVPENPAGDEFECSSAMDDAGNFLVVYKDRGGPTSIAGRYFSVSPPPTPMTVVSTNPVEGNRGDTLDVTITGTNFPSDAVANFNDPAITVNSTTYMSADTIVANITIGTTAFLGKHDVTVTSSTANATGQDLFAVKVAGAYPAPTVSGATPNTALQTTTLNVDLTGNDFANDSGLSVDFGAGITVNSVTFVNGNQIRVNITVSSTATVGLRGITVTNPGGLSGSCTDCFEVIFNPVLYSDDFNDGDASDWIPNKGSWTASSLSYVGTSDGKATSVSPFSGCPGPCSIEANMRRSTGQDAYIALLGWYQDTKNNVELILNKDKGKWILKQRSNGDVVAKGTAPYNLATGVTYHAKIVYDGTSFTVFIDGQQVMAPVPAGAPASGTVAVRVKNVLGTFDDVKVLP